LEVQVIRFKVLLGCGLTAAVLLAAACGGEDRPDVDVIEDGGNGSGSGSVSASGAPSGPSTGAAGYTPVSNVDIYFDQALDLRDLRGVMQPATQGQPVDWAAARAIYEQGKNAKRGDGTPRPLKTLATDANVLALFPNAEMVYGNASFLDTHVTDALNGTGAAQGQSDNARRQMVDKGVQAILYGKALQELAAAKTRVEQGNLDNNTGAPHALDEAWGLIAGRPDESGNLAYGLLATATGREDNFNLKGKLRDPLVTSFNEALKAAQAGNATAFNAEYDKIRGRLNTIFYLGALRYAKQLEGDSGAADRMVHAAEGGSFYLAIRSQVAAASAGAAQTVQSAYTRSPNESFPASATAQVYAALNEAPVLQALAIPADLVIRSAP
jgi:Low iron-inducible periplasmic protein